MLVVHVIVVVVELPWRKQHDDMLHCLYGQTLLLKETYCLIEEDVLAGG